MSTITTIRMIMQSLQKQKQPKKNQMPLSRENDLILQFVPQVIICTYGVACGKKRINASH